MKFWIYIYVPIQKPENVKPPDVVDDIYEGLGAAYWEGAGGAYTPPDLAGVGTPHMGHQSAALSLAVGTLLHVRTIFTVRHTVPQ